MSNYVNNLETGKIELHFDKSDYMALPEDQKKEIKSTFLFSRYVGAWVSRAKDPNTWRAIEVARKLGLSDGGTVGEKLSFSEQVERSQNKAAARAERFEARAEKASDESTRAYEKAKQIGSYIPMGQPILVGHHSEGRHRRDIAKIDNAMRKSCELDDKAKYYEGRAESAGYNASDAKFKNIPYLLNRIDECKKELRAIAYRLALAPSEASKEALKEREAEWSDRYDFFQTKLEEAGGGAMTAKRLKEMCPKYVKVKGEWWPLKSINRDTVTVLNWLGIARLTWKFRIPEIKSMEAGYVIQVLDRDGNEVKPTIKYK